MEQDKMTSESADVRQFRSSAVRVCLASGRPLLVYYTSFPLFGITLENWKGNVCAKPFSGFRSVWAQQSMVRWLWIGTRRTCSSVAWVLLKLANLCARDTGELRAGLTQLGPGQSPWPRSTTVLWKQRQQCWVNAVFWACKSIRVQQTLWRTSVRE